MARKWFEFACSRGCGAAFADMAKVIDHEAKCGRVAPSTRAKMAAHGRRPSRRTRADRPAA